MHIKLPSTDSYPHSLGQLSRLIIEAFFCSGWWLTQRLPATHGVESKRRCSHQPEMGHLDHILFLQKFSEHQGRGSGKTEIEGVCCRLPSTAFWIRQGALDSWPQAVVAQTRPAHDQAPQLSSVDGIGDPKSLALTERPLAVDGF